MFRITAAAVVMLSLANSKASASHPVNQQTIDEIKSLTKDWVPHSVESNPLAKMSVK